MEQPDQDPTSDDLMDSFLDKFQSQPYRGGFHEDQWEEVGGPGVSAQQAKTYKDEGNDYFKEKDYKKAVISYTEGLKKKCADPDLNAVLYTNRAAAQYYLGDTNMMQGSVVGNLGNDYCLSSIAGNFRSALNDVTAARKLKPCHLKAIIRGALCHLELKHFAEAVNWCDEGLQIDTTEKKLLEMRAKADKLKRIEQRDVRKATLKEKKERNQNEALLQAIKEFVHVLSTVVKQCDRGVSQATPARNIRLSEAPCEDEDSASEGLGELFLDGLSSENPHGARLSLDDQGRLSWPVLFLYPEYAQSDFISAFHEDSRFIDHLMVMFGETPSWDVEQKYCPDNLEVYFEDEDRAELYRVPAKSTLLQVLQHHRPGKINEAGSSDMFLNFCGVQYLREATPQTAHLHTNKLCIGFQGLKLRDPGLKLLHEHRGEPACLTVFERKLAVEYLQRTMQLPGAGPCLWLVARKLKFFLVGQGVRPMLSAGDVGLPYHCAHAWDSSRANLPCLIDEGQAKAPALASTYLSTGQSLLHLPSLKRSEALPSQGQGSVMEVGPPDFCLVTSVDLGWQLKKGV
ncbi:Tetratricopeptide repeat protein 4 [Saguinus oedipus]|uniref:Tetratricopeptide repeat protein 4 n=1 Tax=Saguinus oedipus TaxID=9490 RepID=A0ABQ9VDS8_SAGOE|nr:Tetratricopeptide repeat protein 4 [Saguinus oedipus]